MTKRLRADGSAPSTPRHRGSLERDGSWAPWMDRPTPLEHYVRSLVRVRLAGKVSPSTLAAQISTSSYRDSFPVASAGAWDGLGSWTDWASVPCSTTAEELVKRCGLGHPGYWMGGTWTRGETHDETPSPPTEAAVEALAELGFEFGGEA